jgi:hypothetical protein
MGLDQYLYANVYLSEANFLGEQKQNAFAKVKEALEADSFICEDFPALNVNVKVGQWRKANQIHQWFVDNVQDGEDNCKEYYVEREQLEELKSVCEQVIADKTLAEDLLPPASGFFFGSYEIDEWYWEQVKDTVEQLERVLTKVPEGWSFAYDSSW